MLPLREIAFTSESYAKGDDDKVLIGTQMVWSKPISYFLKRAPDEISSSDVSEMRRELMAIACPKSKEARASSSARSAVTFIDTQR